MAVKYINKNDRPGVFWEKLLPGTVLVMPQLNCNVSITATAGTPLLEFTEDDLDDSKLDEVVEAELQFFEHSSGAFDAADPANLGANYKPVPQAIRITGEGSAVIVKIATEVA